MVYEREKIKRLIEYKDKVINESIKNDLEWILEKYNSYYIRSIEFDEREKENKMLFIKCYDLEDENIKMKEDTDLFKRRYRSLKETYRELKKQYEQCCKKLKSMI